MKATKLQKILSYIYPVKIWQGSGTHNEVLELLLSRGQWQLATEDALYSDGTRYRPVLYALRKIKRDLRSVKKALVLGCGLGSTVQIMDRMGFRPMFTLVDNDSKVLELASELAGLSGAASLVCADAERFVAESLLVYDLIIIDIFTGRKVPAFVSSEAFLKKCRSMLGIGGILIVNFMVNSPEDARHFETIKLFLNTSEVIDLGLNQVLIARA